MDDMDLFYQAKSSEWVPCFGFMPDGFHALFHMNCQMKPSGWVSCFGFLSDVDLSGKAKLPDGFYALFHMSYLKTEACITIASVFANSAKRAFKNKENKHMTRKEMVMARTNELNKLKDRELINIIVKYFRDNATMPGEKSLKDRALMLKGEFDENIDFTGLFAEVRESIIEEFASLCVKEVKVKGVKNMNETKKNKDTDRLTASRLPMVLSDVIPMPVNNVKNVYDLPVCVADGGIVGIKEDETSKFTHIGLLPAGFKKNHRTISGSDALVKATDHSNGKFANMSYSMLIDLCPAMA